MSAFCPSCGVAVVAGYVRCPKCQTPLPQAKRAPLAAGGTAVDTGGGFPVVPVAIGVAVIIGIVVAVVVSRGGKEEVAKTAGPAEVVAPPPSTPAAGSAAPAPEPSPTAAPTAPSGPDAAELAAIIDRDLKKQRLWGTVEVVGTRIDVRSSGCEDAAMAPILDGQLQALRSAGLTKLRCLEQSGRVVLDRDL